MSEEQIEEARAWAEFFEQNAAQLEEQGPRGLTPEMHQTLVDNNRAQAAEFRRKVDQLLGGTAQPEAKDESGV